MGRKSSLPIALILFASLVNGQSSGWFVQTSPKSNNLYGVAFSDSATWVAVGDTGMILRSTDGGISWSEVSSPVTDALRAVTFSGNTGIAVGIAGRVLRTTDAGATWTAEPRPTTRALYSAAMDSQFAVITGEEGGIFTSTDLGVTWTPHTAGTASVLFGVSVSGNVGVGVGGQGAVVMSDNQGGGWGLTVLGTSLTFFYGVSFPDPVTGWAVGAYPPTGSIIIRSDVSGFTWAAQTTPTSEQLFGVSFTDTSSGTAVGSNGAIIHTSDGGRLWSVQASGVSQWLNAVAFVNPRFGIAVGNGGTILRTSTGGLTEVETGPGRRTRDPQGFGLAQNYPNPFNPTTTIAYQVPVRSGVVLKVFDLLGREVATLVDEVEEPGSRAIQFDASALASGTYVYRMQIGSYSQTMKLLLVR